MNKSCWRETWHIIKQKPILCGMMIILYCFCGVIIIFSLSVWESMLQGEQVFEDQYVDTKYYSISDNLVGKDEERFFKQTTAIVNLRQFVNDMHDNFTYLELYTQPVDIADYKGDINCLYGYEDGFYDSRPLTQKYALPNSPEYEFSSINAVWADEVALANVNLELASGRNFASSEFLLPYSSERPIPVIMGAEYSSYYKLGDQFFANFLVTSGIAEVVGFLPKNFQIPYRSGFTNLNRYIILPMFDIQTTIGTGDNYLDQKILYLMKINGTIKTDTQTPNDIQNAVSNICYNSNIIPVSGVDMATNQPSRLLNLDMKQIREALTGLSVGFSIFTIAILALFMTIFIRENRQYIAILLINGFSMKEVNRIVFAILQTLTLIGGGTATIGTCFLLWASGRMPMTTAILGIVILQIVALLLAGVLPIKLLSYKDLSEYLCIIDEVGSKNVY